MTLLRLQQLEFLVRQSIVLNFKRNDLIVGFDEIQKTRLGLKSTKRDRFD